MWAKSPWEVVNVPPDDASPARGGDADDGDGDGDGANADEGACGQGAEWIAAAFSRDAHETASAMFSCFNPAFAPSLVFIQPQIEMLKR